MKIGIFAYNFEHWKTQEGIINLLLNGKKPEVVFAADKVKLDFYQSKIRTSPKDLFLQHPKKICDNLNIPYYVVGHDSSKIKQLVEEYDLDTGIILGARIIKRPIIELFSKGIINMHPGILPMNRGLDNLKWAIYHNMPIGVTSHLIDEKIDRGFMIIQKTIKVYEDDTLIDLNIRLQNLEQELMVESLDILDSDGFSLNPLGSGKYFKAMDKEKELILYSKFEKYKKCLNYNL